MQKIKERLLAHYHSMTSVGKRCLWLTLTVTFFLLSLAFSVALASAAMGRNDMSKIITELISCAMRCAAAGFLTTLIGDRLLRSIG